MEELNAALHKFNKSIVEASRHVSRDAITFCMTQVILPVLEKVGDLDVRFQCASPMPNDAYFPGMKASCMNEFELTVILTNLLTAKTFEDLGRQDTNLSCYGRVIPQQSPHLLGDVLIDSGPLQGLVSAHKVRHIFAQLVSQAVPLLPVLGMTVEILFKECWEYQEEASLEMKISVIKVDTTSILSFIKKQQETTRFSNIGRFVLWSSDHHHCTVNQFVQPVTVVKIFRGPEVFIFELVPAFMFQQDWPSSATLWPDQTKDWSSENDVKIVKDAGFYALALPCSADLSDPSLFRISFSMAEKYLLRTILPEDYKLTPICRKDIDRILRMIRESDKDSFSPVNSYHIKTVLLHECMHWPDPGAWAPEKLAERFLEMLRDLILALENQELPHFFIRDCNLLRHYPSEQLSAAAGRLRAIYHDIYMSPSTSIRLQC